MAAIEVLVSTTEPGPDPRRTPRRQGDFVRELRRNISAYGFLIGALLCFGLFSWYPMVREFIMSFQKQKLGRTRWVGMHNFNQVWNDPSFGQAWRNTLYFTLLALLLGYAVPFFVAVVLNEFRHARAYLRVVVYLPVMLPPVASLVLFQYFYNPEYGLFDHILHAVGLPTLQWLQSANTSMIAVVIASTWMNMGGATLIYLAALQGIPGELYEAAEIDGAGILRRVWHVTIPQTRLILSMLLMLQIVATMQVFVEPFVLTNGGQGVDNSTTTIVYLVYQYAFNFSNYGAASALGLLLLLVLVAFALVYRWISRRAEQ
ncbi:carbohydrate ABC transporter membrane protein 1 (CUT1 family) [Streptomyces sp. 846.5]|nr:sugar ABC transporter permease [Streptomyces sp. 846.5]TDT95879.1 carbohydrate ABC transporter membrane protein 1 (CUT1 family) [Streptomyces sp. 846.5]